jgi:hypothetical protein
MKPLRLSTPCSSMAYLVVRAIMGLVEDKGCQASLDTSALRDKISIMMDFEDHANCRSVDEAFWRWRVRGVKPTSGAGYTTKQGQDRCR